MNSIRLNFRSGIGVFTSLVLGASFVPSFTKWSEHFQAAFPSLSAFTGPINLAKLFLPVALLLILTARSKSLLRPASAGKFLAGIWLFGTLTTLFAASGCGFPSSYLREWFAITAGCLYALLFWLSDPKVRSRVVEVWVGILALNVLLELFFPSSIDSLLANVFDPQTRHWDQIELNAKAMTGVFGRQSLAKLMAWVPWLWIAFSKRGQAFARGYGWLALGLWTGLIMATSQRGPFLAMVGASLCFLFVKKELAISIKRFSLYWVTVGVVILIFVPKEIWVPRLAPWWVSSANVSAPVADAASTSISHINVRGKYFESNLRLIRENPWGTACVPESFYREYLYAPVHSHHLWLEQAKERGILFGLLHLGLWLFVGWKFARRAKHEYASRALFAGWIAVQISGQTDHPWQVINHAVVLATFIASAWIVDRPAVTSSQASSESRT